MGEYSRSGPLHEPVSGTSAASDNEPGLAVESGVPQVSALIPGASETALRMTVEAGMRITTPMLLMATKEFGDWPNTCRAIQDTCDRE